MKPGDENTIVNVRKEEKKLEQAVLECIHQIDASLNKTQTNDDDLNMEIVKDYTNPSKEEINEQLNILPSIMAYYNNMKVYAQLLLDIAEYELNIAEVTARGEYKKIADEKQKNYEIQIQSRLSEALKCEVQDKALMTVRELIKALKPKDPTDRDFDAYIKSKTQEQQRAVIIHRNRFNKIKEFCISLNNKYLAVRALRYSIAELNNVDKIGSYN